MKKALVVVDVQNDFCPGGALAVPGGDEVVPVINDMISDSYYDAVVFTRDWHPYETPHFDKWPRHCVSHTPGAQFHAGLRGRHRTQFDDRTDEVVVVKGQEGDGYSGFEGNVEGSRQTMESWLNDRGITHLVVVGLATDYCVRATVLAALERGFSVDVSLAGVRGVDPATSLKAIEDMVRAGAEMLP